MEQFPHLKFVQKITGPARLPGSGPNEISEGHKKNRAAHTDTLKNNSTSLKNKWITRLEQRESENLAELNPEIIPVFLKLNPALLSGSADLKPFGIEIISEEEDGFILGASVDGLKSLEEKIEGFLTKENGSGRIADFWEIIEGNNEEWKPEHVLSESLWEKWSEIEGEVKYQLDIGIAFDKPLRPEPNPNKQGGVRRLERYRQEQIERDNQLMERQDSFSQFIEHYGNLESGFIDLDDSFSCRVEISGKGLKDLVHNYPFVFEVVEVEEISGVIGSTEENELNEIEITAPNPESPEIAVLDSGIMEGHKYLSLAINSTNSKSYVAGDTSTADKVAGGGRGTKVAGAMLYPNGISSVGSIYQLPFFVRNLRILNEQNQLIDIFPAELMKQIVEENETCRVFNLSVNSRSPFRKNTCLHGLQLLMPCLIKKECFLLYLQGIYLNLK